MKPNRLLMAFARAGTLALVLALAPKAQAQTAITVPWIPTDTALPHETYSGRTITLKGIARGGGAQYMWNFGDGTSSAWKNITNSYNLGVQHMYTGNVNQLFEATLSIADSSGNVLSTANYPVQIYASPTASSSGSPTFGLPTDNTFSVVVAIAEDEALWYLHTNLNRSQYSGGANGYGQYYAYGQSSEASCATLEAFDLHGSKPQQPYGTDPYVEDTQDIMNYLMYNAVSGGISNTNNGNPDSNGNGHGIYIGGGDNTYVNGICAAAVASTGYSGGVAATGPSGGTYGGAPAIGSTTLTQAQYNSRYNTGVYNRYYSDIVQDTIDWFAYGQGACGGCWYQGGWYYTSGNGGADGSTNQWPIVGMLTATANMNSTVPAFVKNNIPSFLSYIHYTGLAQSNSLYGGYGYTTASLYPNVAKTGGAMLGDFFVGATNTDGNIESGIGFMYNNWTSYTPNDWTAYNLGNSYAMYDVMKAMQAAPTPITAITNYNNGSNASFNWYQTQSGQSQPGLANWIINEQNSVSMSASNWGEISDNQGTPQNLTGDLDTAWDELILARAVANVPPQAVICNCSEQWPASSPVTLDGSCSIEPNLSRAIVQYNWDFNYNGTFVQSTQNGFPVGGTVSSGGCVSGEAPCTVTNNTGYPLYTEYGDGGPVPGVSYPVALQVVDNNPVSLGGPQSSITTCNVIIKPPPHCPVASTGGPYIGYVNTPVQFNASGSTQIDGLPLTYAWDFENLNVFQDSFLVNPTHSWASNGVYPIELDVTSPSEETDAGLAPGCTVTAYTTVTIGRHAPIANAGGPYTATPGETITLNGSGSSDPDKNTFTYGWDLTGRGLYQDSTLENPPFTVAAGTAFGTAYTVCLEVSDAYLTSTPSCNTVTVIEQHTAPTCVIANAAAQTCTGGSQSFLLDGSHSTDPNGDAFTYAWSWVDGGTGCPALTTPTASQDTAVFNTAGEGCNTSCVAQLTVTNNYGSHSCSETITIPDTVLTPAFNNPPQNIHIECNSSASAAVAAWLASPGATEACVSANNPVTLANNFQVQAGCGGVGAANTVNGSQTVTWTAIDPCNSNTVQASATVTMQDTTPPVLMMPANAGGPATGPRGAAISYTVTALDAAWGVESVSCAPVSGYTFAIGSTKVTCTSTDQSGNTATGSFNVVVTDTTPPTLTLTNVSASATSAQGALVTFTESATDVVDGPTSVSCTPASGSLFAIGSTTVTCSSSDSHGNTATGQLTVTVVDTTPPTISVPQDETIQAAGSAGTVLAYNVSATDVVSGSTPVTCIPASGSTFPIGLTTVSCTSTDPAHNTGTASFHVTVVDTRPPVVTVPANITTQATSSAGAIVTFSATATDVVDGTTSVTCNPASGSPFPIAATTVTCSSTDSHNNTGSSTFVVTVLDSTPPVLTVPANLVVEATGPTGAIANFSASATDTVDGTDPVSCVPASGTTFALGATTVNCSATDAHGNKTTKSFTVTVQDTTPPSLTTPANQTLQATSAAGAIATFSVTATDAVSGNTLVTCSPLSGSTFAIGTTTVTCSSTDAHNNSASITFTVTVQDTNPPVVTVPANMTVQAANASGAVVTFAATAVDTVDGPTAVTCNPSSGNVFPIGATVVTCTSRDAHGNTGSNTFTVTVQDASLPIVSVPQNMTVEAASANGTIVNFNATATDAVSGNLTPTCVPASGSLFAIKTTTVTCTATDPNNGNMGTNSFTVTVQDKTPPVLSLPSNQTVQATGPSGAIVNYAASATDAVSGNTPVTCVPVSGSTFAIGVTPVSCTSVDGANNKATGGFTVTVVDTVPPTLTVPATLTVEATGPSGATVDYSTSATDPVDGTTSVTCSHPSGSTFPLGTTLVTCSTKDVHNNTTTKSFDVIVQDTTPPVVTVPANMTEEAVNASGSVVTFSATAFDLVSGSTVVTCSPLASGETFPLGTTTEICSSSDAAGNTGTASFTVTVGDNSNPVLFGVAQGGTITVEAQAADGAFVDSYGVTAADVVDGNIPVVCTPMPGQIFPLGPTEVTCTATDNHNNTGSLTFTVDVVDTTPPAITCPASITVASNGPIGASDWGIAEPTSSAIEAFFAGASAVDKVDPAPVMTNNAPSTFLSGQTTQVTFTSTDASHNASSCTASVTVTETPDTVPTLTCPTNATLSSSNGVELDWSGMFRHPVAVELLVVDGAAGTWPLSLSELGDSSVQISSSPLASGNYSVRLRAIDEETGYAIDCNRFLSVTPNLMPADAKKLARGAVPAAPVRY